MSNQKAFTFLEVLITLVVVVVGIGSVIRLFSVSYSVQNEIKRKAQALYLAQESLETVHDAVSYAAVDFLAAPRVSVGGDFGDFEREVIVAGSPKQVTVNVYWSALGGEQSFSLTTLIADYAF